MLSGGGAFFETDTAVKKEEPRMDADKRRSGIRTDHAPKFEASTAEVEDDPNREAGDFEIVQHLADFMIADFFNHLHIDDDAAKGDRSGMCSRTLTALYIVAVFLVPTNAAEAEFDDKCAFVRFFKQSVTELVEDSECATHDRLGFLAVD